MTCKTKQSIPGQRTNIIRGSRKIRMICRGYGIKVSSKSQLIIKSLYSYLVYKLDQEHWTNSNNMSEENTYSYL